MKNTSPLFLEYKEIRRRIERQLANMRAVIGHLLLHLGSMIAILLYYDTNDYSQIDSRLNSIMMWWSFLLLIHGLWVYWKSGTSGKAREAAIKYQLEERLDKRDTELLSNPREAFRLHNMLEEDIRKRSGAFMATLLFLIVNAAMWFIWMYQGRYSYFPWQMAIPFAFMLLIPAAIISFLRRADRESHYRLLLDNWTSDSDSMSRKPKQKRSEDDATVRLSDDGELIEEYEAELSKAKRMD
jgi:hypothetical protein